MFKSFTAILFFITTSIVFAHEGHDHGPSAVQAPKGGLIQSLETVHLELISRGNKISIYTYDTDLKPTQVSKYPVTATTTLPKKKAEALILTDKGDHWEAEFNPKAAHRFTLELAIEQGGHKDKVKFTVEPKK